MKLLIDECLHTSLVTVAHSAGHSADHVSHRGLGGLKDWQLMRVIREEEYTFLTNNRSDFLDLHGKEPVAGEFQIWAGIQCLFLWYYLRMRHLILLFIHLVTTVLRTVRPGGYVL